MKKTIQILGSIFFASALLLSSCTKEEVKQIENETVNTIENINLRLFLDGNFIQLFDADNDFIELIENLNIEEGEELDNLLANLENVTSESELLDALNNYGTIDNMAVTNYLNIKENLTNLIFNNYPELQDLTEEQLVEYLAQEWLMLKSMTTIDGQLAADVKDCKTTRNRNFAVLAGGSFVTGLFGTPAAGGALLIIGIVGIKAEYDQCISKAYADFDRRK